MKEQRAFFPASWPEGVYPCWSACVCVCVCVCMYVCAYKHSIREEQSFGLTSCSECGDHMLYMWAQGRQVISASGAPRVRWMGGG